jgi:outer membrane murein-binding lipoprotein Lpp
MEWLGVERRRLGTGLLVFGLVGMVLAVIIAAGLLAGGIAARNLDDRISADQARLSAALTRMTTSIDKLAAATQNAGATLHTTGAIVGQAEAVLVDLAGISDDLSSSLNFSILGQQPLAGAATKFKAFGDKLRAFEGSTGTLQANLETNGDDMDALVTEINAIGDLVAELGDRVASFDRAGEIVQLIVGGIILGGLLVAWLAIAAGFCAWAGLRLRKAAAAEATAT